MDATIHPPHLLLAALALPGRADFSLTFELGNKL
jgi:hypothetical protein